MLSWSNLTHTIRLWDASDGRILTNIRHDDAVRGAWYVADAPGGPAILSQSDMAVHLFDADSGVERLRIRHDSKVMSATWIANASGRPAILSWTFHGPVRMSDATTGDTLFELGADIWAADAAWIPDTTGGPAILTTSSVVDGNIRLWRADKPPPQSDRMRHANVIHGLTWIEDGSLEARLMSWSADGTIRLWNPWSGAEISKLIHGCGVDDASWVPDAPEGPRILSRSENGAIRLWEPGAEDALLTLRHDDSQKSESAIWAAGAPGGPAILSWSKDGDVRLWDAGSGHERLRVTDNELHGVRWVDRAFDGQPLIFCWSRDGIAFRDPKTGHERLPRLNVVASNVEWIADSNIGPILLAWSSRANSVGLYDPVNGVQRASLRHNGKVVSAEWVGNASGEPAIVTCSSEGTINLWEPTGKLRLQIASDIRAGAVKFVDDGIAGSAILSWSLINPEAQLADAVTGKTLSTFRHDDVVESVRWISQRRRNPLVLSWARDHTIRLWDAHSGQQISRLDLDSNAYLVALTRSLRERLTFAVACMDYSIGCIELLR